MATPNAKEIKKLAAMCRRLGIKHFKGDGFEFTLTDEAPPAPVKAGAKPPHEAPTDPKSEDLTEEELLFWSVEGGQPAFNLPGMGSDGDTA